MADTVDFGEVECGTRDCMGGGSDSVYCPLGKLHASEHAPEGSGPSWASESSSIKTNGCKWPFPNLIGQ